MTSCGNGLSPPSEPRSSATTTCRRSKPLISRRSGPVFGILPLPVAARPTFTGSSDEDHPQDRRRRVSRDDGAVSGDLDRVEFGFCQDISIGLVQVGWLEAPSPAPTEAPRTG